MPRAVVDTSVLFAAAYARDEHHEDGVELLGGFDDASLPEAVVLDYVLAETLNGLTAHAGADAAADFLDRVEANARFHVETLTADQFAATKALFRQYDRFSFVDAGVVAYMHGEGLDYLYAFDDDFDAASEIRRLDAATNPYGPT